MEWKQIFSGLMESPSELEREGLAAALLARGNHALSGGGDVEADESLRRFVVSQLVDAVLYPGTERLRARFDEARAYLSGSGYPVNAAERAIASVLNARDHCWIRARALEAVQWEELAREVRRRLTELDAFLQAHPEALEAVSWLKEETLAASLLPDSGWNWVPDSVEVDPSMNATFAFSEPLSEDDLTQVALGTVDESLERRVALALKVDPKLRERYDAILADLEIFEAPAIVPLSVFRMLRNGAHAARPRERRAAAAQDQLQARYEDPGAEDEIFSFSDGSQLFAQKRAGGWVLFLYRVSPREGDGFLGTAVEHTWSEKRLLAAETRAGEVEVRCNGEIQRFRLDDPHA